MTTTRDDDVGKTMHAFVSCFYSLTCFILVLVAVSTCLKKKAKPEPAAPDPVKTAMAIPQETKPKPKSDDSKKNNTKESSAKTKPAVKTKLMEEREQKIAQGLVVRRQSDYPQLDDVLSDLSGEETKKTKTQQ